MPEYLAPGVYIEEIECGPEPIEGAATSTAAFLGATERGPSRPRLVTSYSEYLRAFGGIVDPAAYMPHAVNAFFDNGGRRAYIARISGANAARATATVAGFSLRATGAGTAYNRVWVRIDEGTTKDTNQQAVGFRLRVYYWDTPGPGSRTTAGPSSPVRPRRVPNQAPRKTSTI